MNKEEENRLKLRLHIRKEGKYSFLKGKHQIILGTGNWASDFWRVVGKSKIATENKLIQIIYPEYKFYLDNDYFRKLIIN